MYKSCSVFIFMLSIAITTIAFADENGKPPAVPGTTLTTEALANTIEARRTELKEVISKTIAKEPKKAITAAYELLKIEMPDDIIYLIKVINENSKSQATKEIQDAVLKYPNDRFIISGLKKAGQDISTEVNIIAANLLIDKKDELAALKVMVALIKKGIIDHRVIDIMERVPNRQSLNGIKVAGGQIIYNDEIIQEFQNITRAEAFPADVRVFTLLLTAAYYSCYLENDKEMIWRTLENASQEYLLDSITLLEKVLRSPGNEGVVAGELLRKLSVSKKTDVAKRATKDIEEYEKELKEGARMTLLGKKDSELPQPEVKYQSVRYFSGPKATRADTEFLLKELMKNPDGEMRSSIINTFGEKTNYEEIVLPVLRKIAQEDPSFGMRGAAINGLINRGLEIEALNLLKPLINKMTKSSEFNPEWRPFSDFKDASAREEAKKYLTSLRDAKKLTFNERLYGSVALLTNFEIKDKTSIDVIDEGLKMSSPGIIEAVLEGLSFSARINSINNEINSAYENLEKIKRLEKSGNPIIATLAQNTLKRIYHAAWWHKLEAEEKREKR